MTHESILSKYLSTINYLGLKLEVIDRDSALKAMAEAVAVNEAKLVHEYSKTSTMFGMQLAAKENEINTLINDFNCLNHELTQEIIVKDKEIAEWKELVNTIAKTINDYINFKP